MGKGGSEQRAATSFPQFPRDCRDPLDPRMNSKSRILYMFLQHKLLGPHSGAMFFDFFMDLSAKTTTFESISGRTSSKKALKSRFLDERSMKKSEKHHTIAPLWPKVWESCSKTCFWEFTRQSRGSRGNDVRARCSEPPFPTHSGRDNAS